MHGSARFSCREWRGLCFNLYADAPDRSRGQAGQHTAEESCRSAEEQLIKDGMSRCGSSRVTSASFKLAASSPTGAARKSGLAIFRSKENLVVLLTGHCHFRRALSSVRQFYIEPLLPAISPNLQFFVLAISRNQVRLLKATSDGF